MKLDLTTTPFSRRGSYFALSRVISPTRKKEELYLRTVHGGAKTKELFTVSLAGAHGPESFEEHAEPGRIRLSNQAGLIDICLDERDRVLFHGAGVSLHLEALVPSPYDLVVPISPDRWHYVCYGSDLTLVITVHEGNLEVSNQWTGVKSDALGFRLDPDPTTNSSLLSIEEFQYDDTTRLADIRFDDAVAESLRDFEQWRANAPVVSAALEDAHELAVYVNWSSVVAARGHIARPVMFMSKNWMTNVWAWDHCFNAMALVGDLPTAMDQFLCIFDHQDQHGGLPDCFNDSFVSRQFVKPAVHGWALQWMMGRADLSLDFLAKAYDVLGQWTEWWFTHRDFGGDGFPAYIHGNDSGWDNSTVFGEFVPVESPDQIAFLVVQLEALSFVADRLGRFEESDAWMLRSSALLARLIDEFWHEDRFVARHALTHERVECDSLLTYVPLVLGERLPSHIFETLADRLSTEGFLTEHGLATESTASSRYESDGYWRGPIWAPSTLIIVDGLERGGRESLAGDIARRFCALVSRSGMAENFDALTGEGLRDRAYTWTASVFLVLASQYAHL